MKIGIYAGTFDPVHSGHLVFAKDAMTHAGLDRVIVVAEKDPYRKRPHVSWDHRQAMIERATDSLEHIDHDYRFANELSYQHTMQDMLHVAHRHYGEDNDIWFLVGSDIFEHIHQWQSMALEDEYGGFVVALRDDHTHEWLTDKLSQLESQGIYVTIIVIESAHPHISSSAIRALISNHQTAPDLPKAVAEYIESHRLYQAN